MSRNFVQKTVVDMQHGAAREEERLSFPKLNEKQNALLIAKGMQNKRYFSFFVFDAAAWLNLLMKTDIKTHICDTSVKAQRTVNAIHSQSS